jgi:hypothetical protein
LVEELEKVSERALIERIELERAPGPAARRGNISSPSMLLEAAPRRIVRPAAEMSPRGIQPVAQLRRRRGDMKPRQEIAAVQRHRPLRLPRIAQLLERRRVAPYLGGIEAGLVVSAIDHGFGAEAATQHAKCLAQGGPPVLVVEVGPEDGDEGIATTGPLGPGQGEVAKQRERLGLAQEGEGGRLLRILEPGLTKGPETDHGMPPGDRTGAERGRIHGRLTLL